MEFKGRKYSKLDIDSLLSNLTLLNWEELFATSDPNKAWTLMRQNITSELDKLCPVTNTKIKNYRPDWINPILLDQIRDRDYFYAKAKQTKNEDDWNIAKHLRNQTNANIRRARADYTIQKLHDCAKDGSKFWREIKKIYPSTKLKSPKHKIRVTDDSNELVPENNTANFINNYFINIGTPQSEPPRNKTSRTGNRTVFRPNSRKRTSESFPLWTIGNFTEHEVIEVIKTIEISKSSGLHNVNSKVLKPILKVLAPHLTHIFNLSVENSIFPDSWKEALVIPFPKVGDPHLVTNLRPISLLPQPGNILEKLVHNRLSNYIEENNLLSSKQHGFRKNKSTLDALFQLTEQINLNMDRKLPTLVTYIDFKKAFGCVQHRVLIKKLGNLDIDNKSISWLTDYLCNRQQKVLANNHFSDKKNVKQGVPQGSIVGPLMYIIYANDIARLLKHSKITLYADDTVIYSSGTSLKVAKCRMQKDLRALEKWCRTNDIYVNVKKTKYMLFGSKRVVAKNNPDNIKLEIFNERISRVHNYCYLRVTLDEQLNYECHAQIVIKKLKTKIVQLQRMRLFLNVKAATLVYKNMILPILEYGDIFLSSLSCATLKNCRLCKIWVYAWRWGKIKMKARLAFTRTLNFWS